MNQNHESLTYQEKAIAAYNKAANADWDPSRAFKGADSRQADDIFAKYWDTIVRSLERHNLPVPDLATMRFLDLGGGSDNHNYEGDDGFAPWLGRFLCAMGVPYVVNVDMGALNPEFEDVLRHVTTILQSDDAYNFIEVLQMAGAETSNYDIIFSAMMIDSKNTSPSLPRNISPSKLKRNIMEWAQQLLKPNGYLFFEGGFERYILLEGELVNFKDLKK